MLVNYWKVSVIFSLFLYYFEMAKLATSNIRVTHPYYLYMNKLLCFGILHMFSQ